MSRQWLWESVANQNAEFPQRHLVLWHGTAKTRALPFIQSVPRCVMDLGIGLVVLYVGTSRNWRDLIEVVITTDIPPVQRGCRSIPHISHSYPHYQDIRLKFSICGSNETPNSSF